MAEANVANVTPPPKKKRRWLRVISIIVVVLVLLLVGAYFIGTSSAFFKGVILPRASKSLNAEITVSEASISPFKEVTLHNLRVKTTGDEPLLTAPEVRARYSLMDIIRGNIKVDEVTVEKPTIVLVENPDGSKNTDAFTKGKKAEAPSAQGQKAPAQPSATQKRSKATQLDLKKLAVTDATVRQIKLYAGGKRDVTELAHLNITATDLKNGQTGKLSLASELSVNENPPAPKTNGTLQAKINGTFSVALSPDLKPATVQGSTRLEVAAADHGLADLNTLAASLDCDITPTDVKQVALSFSKANAKLGEVRINGPFSMEKMEGKVTVQVVSLDKQVLNIVGGNNGLDFGPTTVNSTNQIELIRGGSAITATGQLNVNKLQVTRGKDVTPVLDLLARYDVSVDRSASNATLRELTINATQKDRQLLTAGLTSPMNVNWGNPANGVGDSSLNLVVTNLNLADWKPFMGDTAPSGTVNVTTKLAAQQGGKVVGFDLNANIAGLTVISGTNQYSNLAITAHVSGTGRDLNQFTLTEYRAQASRGNQPLATLSGAATYDVTNKAADVQLTAQASVPNLLQVVSPSDQSLSSGAIDFKAHLVHKQDNQAITGNLALNDISGRLGSNQLQNFAAALDLDIGKTPSQIQLRHVSGTITQAGKPGGTFDLTGTYATNKTAEIKLTKASFNQDGVRPFLQSALGDKQLVSISINATASVQYDPDKASAIKADAQVSNLVVKDPKHQLPDTPLEARLAIDAALKKQVGDINKFLLTLTPTQRAKNELQVTGHLDMSNTNYTQGNLKLTADAMDVTSYYDLFAKDSQAAQSKTGRNTPSTRASSSTPETAAPAQPPQPVAVTTTADANKEPDPVKLPLKNFTLEANIGHFFVREADLSDLQTHAAVDLGHVVLNPLKAKVNGGPLNVAADLDLGVPGYKYKLDASAQNVPLAPLVNSFMVEQKGKIGGIANASAKVDGAGTKGASLKHSLTGNFDVNTTNLNFAIPDVRNRILRKIVDVVAVLPELFKNPVAGISAAFGKGSLSQELAKSPIDNIVAKGTMGAGKVNLQQAVVESKVFLAEAHGDVALADVLTNSTLNVPIAISLNRSVANNFGLVPANTPTNTAYQKLPDFLTMRGTVGDPKEDIKYTALAGTVFTGIGSIGGKYGDVFKGLGGILGGGQPNTNAPAATTTNQPATNKSQNLINNALDLLNRNKKP